MSAVWAEQLADWCDTLDDRQQDPEFIAACQRIGRQLAGGS